ncbi:alpha-ketoglutarate-dependent sulfonate dioxygenase [Aspergillus udagawae]|nr:alpha-ketoglutarate-dependent sulfonate dioxygenase [Aspergillus udagawae]
MSSIQTGSKPRLNDSRVSGLWAISTHHGDPPDWERAVKGARNIVEAFSALPTQTSTFATWPSWAIARRGVVFFRAQDNLTNDLRKELILRMGDLTGRPSGHGLHIHPVTNDAREFGDLTPQISTKTRRAARPSTRDSATRRWRLSGTAISRDTLWASGYEIYNRISRFYRAFLETLTATDAGVGFRKVGAVGQVPAGREGGRGAGRIRSPGGSRFSHRPLSCADQWKRAERARNMLRWFHDMIAYGHDLQVRFKWNRPNDIAIWDNRRVFHTAAGDHEGFGPGSGNRAVGVGEIPYFGPANKSCREDLGIEDTLAPCHW